VRVTFLTQAGSEDWGKTNGWRRRPAAAAREVSSASVSWPSSCLAVKVIEPQW